MQKASKSLNIYAINIHSIEYLLDI